MTEAETTKHMRPRVCERCRARMRFAGEQRNEYGLDELTWLCPRCGWTWLIVREAK